MARRSMLFSKKRSSRATISKKRRADNELQQPDSSKRTKKSSFQDDEEEIGDFIVVDTGKFDDHEEAKQGFTIDEDNDTFPTYRTSNTPEIVLEDKEFGVKTRPHISKVDSDTAQQARDALLVLESVSTETAEYKRSRAQTIEISENHLPSGSKNSPVLVSPLTLKEEETSQSRATSPGPTTANLVASISSPLALVVEQSTQPPQVPEEMRADSNSPYPSISLPLASPAQSPVNTAFTQLPLNSSHTPSVTQQVEPVPVQELASEKISNAPQGVLVMKGDQCPSKFVVSGIALDSETDQQVRTKIDPKARNSVSWIETVTEARTNVLPEIPGSRVSGLHPCDNHGSGISEGLGDAPESPRQALAAITDATDASATLTFCSDALQLPQQSRRNCESEASDVHQASTDVQEQLVPDQQRQTSKSFHENETMVPGDTASKRLPLPIQYPKISPQASALVGPNPLRSSADKIVAAWWTTKLSCLDISPSANSRAIPLAVGLRLPMASPSSTLPSLRFTIDNRAESTLTTVEVQRLVQIFVRDAIAIIPREQSTQPKSYPAGIIMWQSLQKFYKWYAKEEKKEKGESSVTTVLKFELLDVHWQPEKVFLLPRAGNLDGFRALKQCIWDLFWVASNLNGASTTFRILVTRAPEKVNEADFHRLTAGKFSAPNQLPGVLSTPTSSHFASETPAEIGNFQGQEPETAQHHHQLPVVHPPPLTINSPPLVTLDVEGAQTPRVLRDFFQNNRSPDNTGPPSMHSSPTRPETNGSSILRTDLPLPSLLRPEKPVTVTSQPKTVTPPPSTPALNSNLDAQYHLSPPYHFETNTNSSSSSQTHDFALPSSQATSAIQLPSLRPSPLTMETSKAETPQTNLVSSSNYTANTARPLFAMPPQKVVTAFRTLLPSIQSNRVTNTAKPVPDFEVTQNPPPPTTDKDKDILTEIVPPIPQTSRTPRDKMMLRDKALQMIAGRQDVELEEDETTGGRKRTYPEIRGVIVDKNSAMGIVVITERGYTVQQVDTGQDVYVDQYTELTLRDGQACVIHGSSTVLYYKTRIPSIQSHPSPPRRPLPSQPRQTREVPKARTSPSKTLEKPVNPALNPIQFITEITIRLQIDAVGHFSAPYDLSVFRPEISNLDFFKWFRSRTNHGAPDGPPKLRVTLKDAMPVAKVSDVSKGDEEGYRKIREDILVQCEKARMFMPRLREFGVLVVDPGWKNENGK